MSDGAKLICGAIIIVALMSCGAMAGAGIATDIYNLQCLKRGLKQYNQQTGQLEWTEKGGGNGQERE